MEDENNKNVVDLFSEHEKNTKAASDDPKRLRYYAGFNYVKVKKDHNGKKFRKDYLLNYRNELHYMVTVMREIDGEIVLYSYDVPNTDLFKFMKSFDENTLDGTIIDINKYFPNEIV